MTTKTSSIRVIRVRGILTLYVYVRIIFKKCTYYVYLMNIMNKILNTLNKFYHIILQE